MATNILAHDRETLRKFSAKRLGNEGAYQPGANEIVVAIPAFNEEIAVGSIIARCKKYVDRVVVVDDGSRDHTVEVAKLLGAEVISHGKNEGKGAAIRDAFEYAKNVKAGILILIDGDGQHNPDEIPFLLAPIVKGDADVVNGSRFLLKKENHVPAYRRVGQEVLTMATNAGTRMHITDTQNGFRAFSWKSFDCFQFHQKGMAIESEMLMDAANAKMRIKEVPIDVRYDVAGSTYNPISHGFGVLGQVVWLIAQRRPLFFFGVMGLLLVLSGPIFIFLETRALNVYSEIAVVYGTMGTLSISLGIISLLAGFVLTSVNRMRPSILQFIKSLVQAE